MHPLAWHYKGKKRTNERKQIKSNIDSFGRCCCCFFINGKVIQQPQLIFQFDRMVTDCTSILAPLRSSFDTLYKNDHFDRFIEQAPKTAQKKSNQVQKRTINKTKMFTMQQRAFGTPAHTATKFVNRNFNQTPVFQRRRSNSTSNCVIEKKRGFKPSDRFDPVKREFLVQLGKKFWCRPPVRNLCSNQTVFYAQPTLKFSTEKKKRRAQLATLRKSAPKSRWHSIYI